MDNVQVFNNSAGTTAQKDVYFNNLTVVPEPSTALLGLLGMMLIPAPPEIKIPIPSNINPIQKPGQPHG